jgi:murein DD-endopeptidase MepM/ murein hydrolase activator NlpD
MRYLLLGGLIYYLLSARRISRILSHQVMRNDAAGLGHFGAPRGSRTHQGLDLLAVTGEEVRSPVTGRFIRTGRPYANDSRYRLAVIHGNGQEWKLMYIDPLPDLLPGTPVKAGQVIGTAQNVAAKYGGPMRNHIHIEVRRIVGAELMDPARLLSLA